MPPIPSISLISKRPPSTCPASRIFVVALMARFAPAATGDLLTPIVGASDIRLGSSGFMIYSGHGQELAEVYTVYLQVNTGIAPIVRKKPPSLIPGPGTPILMPQ